MVKLATISHMNVKKIRNKESYHARRKRAYETLLRFGVSIGLAKRIGYRYPLKLLERLIEETKKRKPDNPTDYFLNGLRRSRIKYGDFRKRDRKRKKDVWDGYGYKF